MQQPQACCRAGNQTQVTGSPIGAVLKFPSSSLQQFAGVTFAGNTGCSPHAPKDYLAVTTPCSQHLHLKETGRGGAHAHAEYTHSWQDVHLLQHVVPPLLSGSACQVRTILVPALETEGPAIRTWRVQGDSGSVTGVTYLDLAVRLAPHHAWLLQDPSTGLLWGTGCSQHGCPASAPHAMHLPATCHTTQSNDHLHSSVVVGHGSHPWQAASGLQVKLRGLP